MTAKLVSVTEPKGKPIWFRTYEFECIDCGKHFTRHRFDSRTNPYCADCHRKHENERQRERIETKKQKAIDDVLDKISAEIKENMSWEMYDEYGNETALCKELMEIIEKYKGVSE